MNPPNLTTSYTPSSRCTPSSSMLIPNQRIPHTIIAPSLICAHLLTLDGEKEHPIYKIMWAMHQGTITLLYLLRYVPISRFT